jgi:nitric oxide dioxygenase
MDPEQLALVQRSFVAATASADQLTSRFYDELFRLAPEVRELFPDDLTLQRQKLFDELTAIVAAVAQGELAARAEPLGARHLDYGTIPAHYDVVGQALLTALAGALGDRWTEASAAAWAMAYQEVAASMLRGAAPESTQTSGQG